MNTDQCDKGPILERMERKFDRIDGKIDKIGDQLVSAAVLAEAHRNLAEKVVDVDKRLKKVEDAPRKAVMSAFLAAIAAMITLFFSQWGPQ